MTVIKPVSLSYMCINLAGLHSGIYCVGLVVYKPIILRRLFFDFLAINTNQIIRFSLICRHGPLTRISATIVTAHTAEEWIHVKNEPTKNECLIFSINIVNQLYNTNTTINLKHS